MATVAPVIDPLKLAAILWPNVAFSKEQIDIIYSVAEDGKTFVPAANMMGKDFVSAFIILWFFISRNPCRIVTTSAKDDHLRVLWDEIGNFINTSQLALDRTKGGDLIVNQREVRKLVGGEADKKSYIIGMVAAPDKLAAMQGHHIAKTGDNVPRTMFVSDESSSVPTGYYTMADTWADRMLVIGNTWPCDNFFKWAVKGKPGTEDKGGNIPRPNGQGFHRRVIKIKATDSPNIRRALLQIEAGLVPDDKVIIPGIKTYGDYEKNLLLWDEIQKCVCLDADWYEGADVYMFPKPWMDASEELAIQLLTNGGMGRARSIGVDSAEGGDNTSWAVVGHSGLIKLISKKTPDTSIITGDTIGLMREYGVDPYNVLFDRGGGGKEHADRLRQQGYNVRTVAFGETVTPELKRRGVVTQLGQRIVEHEERYVYKNRRAEMYGLLRQRLNPVRAEGVPLFAIPRKYSAIRQQLTPIPLQYDGEGRMVLPPKRKADPNSKVVTLIDIIGHSPDEADALVLGVYGLVPKTIKTKAGVI